MDCLIERPRTVGHTANRKGMIDVVNHRCKNGCQAMTYRHKYDGYCVRCYIYLYPDESLSLVIGKRKRRTSANTLSDSC